MRPGLQAEDGSGVQKAAAAVGLRMSYRVGNRVEGVRWAGTLVEARRSPEVEAGGAGAGRPLVPARTVEGP